MNEVVIKVENLCKQYRLGVINTGWLVKDLQSWWAHVRGKEDPNSRIQENRRGISSDGRIWALKDLSLDVRRGEVLGIIGRNGAGKSTLLKILTKVTLATSGTVRIKGRVASLLEVGTGFHPELTGRENIYLNGAILGMQRAEITRKFHEIVGFAEVQEFIDTPVKRYSSGMHVRLAFAVAAHLDPEILLVDEVLAVGDAEFQKKCLNKMEDVSHEGRTILFVSHNMPSITRLCDRAILLDEGQIVVDGPADEVVAKYLRSDLGASAKREWPILEEAPGNDFVRVRSVRVVNDNLKTVETVDIRESVGIEIVFDIFEQRSKFVPMISLYNDQGVHILNALDTDPAWRKPRKKGHYASMAWIPGNLLAEGRITVSVLLSTHSVGRAIRQAGAFDSVAFHVFDPIEGDSARGDYVGGWGGAVRPLLRWTTQFTDQVAHSKESTAGERIRIN